MKNILYNINKKGLNIIPVLPVCPESVPAAGLSRVLSVSSAAVLVSAAGVIAGRAIAWIINAITALVFYGDIKKEIGSAGSPEPGIWSIAAVVAGALLLTVLLKYSSLLLRALGITVAIGGGAPQGAESPVMIFTGALGNWAGKLLGFTAAERHLLFITGACSVMAAMFGAPVAAVFLAMEVLLPEWSITTLLPATLAAATAAAGNYLLNGTTPVYNLPAGPAPDKMALLAYCFIGLIIGLWAALSIKLSRLVEKWFGKLTIYNRWYPLLAAFLVGATGWFAPRVLGTGSAYINDLLQAHVTLSILFALGILKLVAWLLFSGAYKTGSGITPLLITGGAAALLAGVIIQLVFPSLILHSGMIVLVGMGAMLAGTSRALLTAIIFAVEVTHQVNVALPLCLACLVSYGISWCLISKRKADEYFALQQ